MKDGCGQQDFDTFGLDLADIDTALDINVAVPRKVPGCIFIVNFVVEVCEKTCNCKTTQGRPGKSP